MKESEEKPEGKPHEINQKVTNILRTKNIPQTEIATLLETTPATVSRKLSSQKPLSVTELEVIAKHLSLNLIHLIYGSINEQGEIDPPTNVLAKIGPLDRKKSPAQARQFDAEETALERHEEVLSRLTRIERQINQIISKLSGNTD